MFKKRTPGKLHVRVVDTSKEQKHVKCINTARYVLDPICGKTVQFSVFDVLFIFHLKLETTVLVYFSSVYICFTTKFQVASRRKKPVSSEKEQNSA